LWQLIKAAPGVFANGDEPPASVREATADLLDENDVAKPFIQGCLTDDKGGLTQIEMQSAIQRWLQKQQTGVFVGDNGHYDRIMNGVRGKYKLGRFYRDGKQLRGFMSVRLVATESP
jgi:hypothetical protein